MEKEKFKIKSKIDFYTDIVSTNANDRPLIYISNEAIELKHNNDKLKEENDLLKNRIDIAIKYIKEHRQTYDIDGSKEPKLDDFDILASPKVLLNILRGEDKE